MKKKIYIAGKVTGLPQDEVVAKFAKAQKDIEALGFEVINPIEVVKDFEMPWNKAMRMCIAGLTECDAIALLPDWHASKGARLESELSIALDMPNFRCTEFGLQDLKYYRWNS